MVSKDRKRKQAAKRRNLVRNERELADPNLKIKRLQRKKEVYAKSRVSDQPSQNTFSYENCLSKATLLTSAQSDRNTFLSFQNDPSIICQSGEEENVATPMNKRPFAHFTGRESINSASVLDKISEKENDSEAGTDSSLLHFSAGSVSDNSSDKENESEAYSATNSLLQLPATPNGSSPIGEPMGKQNLSTPSEECHLIYLSDKVINAESVSDKVSEKENERTAHLVISITPKESCLNGQPFGGTNLITPVKEHIFIETADKRLVLGKSISDKYGKESLRNLSLVKCGATGKNYEDAEQQNERNSDKGGLLNLPTRRTLFPDESISVNYDVQENESGNTVMFSLKRKLNRKVEGKPAYMKPTKECFLVSPVQKKIMLAMQNRVSNTNNGGVEQDKCNAQSDNLKSAGSTVFLLKRKLKAKVSPSKKFVFMSPLKKKRMLTKLKYCNQDLLMKKGESNASDESLVALSSVDTSVQTSPGEQDKVKTHGNSFTSFVEGVSSPSQPATENILASRNQSASTANKKKGVSRVKRKLMHTRFQMKRINDKRRYASSQKTKLPKKQLLSGPQHTKTIPLHAHQDHIQTLLASNDKHFAGKKTGDQKPGVLTAQASLGSGSCNDGNDKTDAYESSFPFSATGIDVGTQSRSEHKDQSELSASQNSCSSYVIKRKFMQLRTKLRMNHDKQSDASTQKSEQQLLPSSKPETISPLHVHQGQSKTLVASKVKRCVSKKPIRRLRKITSVAPSHLNLSSSLLMQKKKGCYSRAKSDANLSSTPINDTKVSSGCEQNSISPLANPAANLYDIRDNSNSDFVIHSNHSSESELNSNDKVADAPAASDGTQVRATAEEEFIAQRESNIPFEGNAESQKIDERLNPTFKKLKVFSGAKLKKNVFQLKWSKPKLKEEVARRLKGSRSSARVEAERLVKWCLKARGRLIVKFEKTYKSLVTRCDNWLTIAEQYSELTEKSEAILGLPVHTSSTEGYFYETAYKYYNEGIKSETRRAKIQRMEQNRVGKTQAFDFPLTITDDGKVTNMFPPIKMLKKSFQWDCSSFCRTDDKICVRKVGKIFRKLKQIKLGRQMVYFLRDMNKCKSSCSHSDRRGHSAICRMKDGNGAPMVILQNLKPHYPHVRVVVRELGSLKSNLHKIDDLDSALYEGDRKKLEAIAEQAKLAGGEFKVGDVIFNDEDAIQKKYDESFKALEKRMGDLPINYCFSCEKLLSLKNLTNVSKMRKIPDNKWWKELIKKGDDGVSIEYICEFCLRKIRANQLPSIATLNKMKVPEVPAVIQNLNKFEKVFIQRAKAFQVVAKAGTVSGKNLPASHLNSKVIGRTFHLPLPLEETMKRILRDEQAVMPNQELYILVRGLPTNQKKIWETLVNVTNVLKTLEWYKKNNPLYKDIELPNAAEKLLNTLEHIHYDDPDSPPTPDDQSPAHDPNRTNVPNEQPAPVDPNESDGAELSYDENDIGAHPENPHSTAGNSDSATADPDNTDVQRRDVHPTAAQTVADIAAMLTQRDKDDAFYDNFTIFPVYERRENTAPNEMYQMLKVQGSTMDSRAQKLDALCFPDLYPDGQNYFHEEREVPVQFSEFVKAKLMSRHPQFRMNIQYLFFLLNQLTTRQLAAGIYQTLNITRKKFTAGEFMNRLGTEDVEREMCSIFSRVRNTEQFWKIPRCQLYCMLEKYGPATFFFTYSPSLHDDEELDAYLRAVNNVKGRRKTTSQLIADDPVSTSRFCDQKFKGIMEFLTASKDGPLGEIVHYAWRREYQGRGTQHFHTLLWVKNAPVLGVSSSEEIAEFIQKHITCSIPDKNTFTELHKKVINYQIHRDNPYCLRGKGKRNKKVCRFGFPRPISDKFILRDVPTSIAGRRNLKSNTRLYDLPRKEDEVRVNDYNPALLLAVKHGNMDIQYVGEKSGIIVKYISKYVCKPEKSHMNDVFRDINNTKNQFKKLWSIGSVGLSNRECHALEAADTALGIPLFGTDKDTVFKWIDVHMFRSRKLKTRDQIKRIAETDPENTDLYCRSMIDDQYPYRPEELEDVCLHDYVRDYDIVKTTPMDENVVCYEFPGFGYLRKRKKPYVINHSKYDAQQNPEQYFYSILLLYKPWRQIDDLKSYTKEGEVCQYATFFDAFEAEKDSLRDALVYHEKRAVLQAAHEAVTKLIDEKSKEFQGEEKNIDFEADDPHGYKAAEARDAMDEYEAAAANLDPEDLSTLEGQLNEDQRRVYEYVKSALQSKTPMRHYVSGVGGTGKSFLIKCIAKYCRENLKKDVAITGPTGISAWGIGGQTVHRLLQLPIQHGENITYSALNDAVLNILRMSLKNTVLLIIDEVSMVSSLMLMFINLRLNEIFNTFLEENAYFGNIHVLVLGDLLQLPPVKASLPFIQLTDKEIKTNFVTNSGFNLWKLFTYDELQINMRQKSDQKFANLLANVRLGFYSSDDMDALLQRKVVFKSNTADGRTKELAELVMNHGDKPVVLLPTRKMCERLNKAVLSLLGGTEICLESEDSVDCRSSDKSRAMKQLKRLESDCSRTAGMDKKINVKVGARVMLRRNIDVTEGYVNGAVGTILSATMQNGKTACLELEMKGGKILKLTPILSKFELFPGIYVHRKQFPIQLAYALTVHKAQGLSLDSCIVDVGNQCFSEGQTYVALSRARTLSGLHIINIDPRWITADIKALKEYGRLRSITKHLKSTAKEMRVTTREHELVKDDVWAPKEESVNVFDETPPPKKLKASSLLPAFENSDNVSCYANVVLQCLLSYEPLRSTLRRSVADSALKQLADRYVKTRPGELLSALSVRTAADPSFAKRKMEDATSFLLFLINQSDALKQMTEFTESFEKKCHSCKETTVRPELWSLLQMPPDHKKVSDFLQKRCSWSEPTDFECPKCHRNSKAVERFLITNPSDLFIVKVLLWDVDANNKSFKHTKYQMTALPSTNLKIGDCRFRLHSAAFHSGRGVIEVHHTAIVQFGKKFILADDSEISECKWPRGSKGAFLLFYCKIDSKKSVQVPLNAPLKADAKSLTSDKTDAPLDLAKPLIHEKIDALLKAPLTVVMKPLARTRSEVPKCMPSIKNLNLASYADTSSQCLPSYKPKVSDVITKSTGVGEKKQLGGTVAKTAVPAESQALTLPAFENESRVCCYANASLQSLLSYNPLRIALSDSEGKYALKDIANQYRTAGQTRIALSAILVRQEAGHQFAEERQQDPHEFLNAIIERHATLQENVKFTLVDRKKCNVCGYEPLCNAAEYRMLSLPANEGETDVTQILDKFLLGSTISDSTCGDCRHGNYVETFAVKDPSNVFILHFKLWNNQMVKNKSFQMKDIPSTDLIVDSVHYRFHSATFHHGESPHSGHYTAIVRSQSKFILANDAEITECRWPEKPTIVNQNGNETAVNAYLLFYYRVK